MHTPRWTTPRPRSRPNPRPTQKRSPSNPTLPPPAPRGVPPRAPAHVLKGGRRNKGARCRRVGTGGAAGTPDELETREAEAGVRYGCCEADLGAQRRDHEGTNERRPVFILRRSSYRSGTSFVLTSLRRRRHRGRFAGSFGTLRVDFDLVDGVGERGVGEARRAAGGRGRRSVSYRFRVSFLSDTYLMYCDVSCMYLECILMCPVDIHQDQWVGTTSRGPTGGRVPSWGNFITN